MYKNEFVLNYLQWLIHHKNQPNQILYIWYICIKRIWHSVTKNDWYAIKPNKANKSFSSKLNLGNPSDVTESKFELQSRYYSYVWTNTLGKGINSFIITAVNQLMSLLSFTRSILALKCMKVNMLLNKETQSNINENCNISETKNKLTWIYLRSVIFRLLNSHIAA